MYGDATKFYKAYPKQKCKYQTFLKRLWKGMKKESAIIATDFHFFGAHDTNGHTCPRCMTYKAYEHFYSSRSEKNGKDNVCSDCRKRQAKFNWANNPKYKENHDLARKRRFSLEK